MPIGYLITAVLWAALALVAMSPPMPSSTRPWSWSFILTMTVIELPFFAMYVLIWSTASTALSRDLSNPVGFAALVAAAIGMGALVVIARRGLASRTHLAAALDTSLSAGDALPRRHPWWRVLVAPLSFHGRQVRREANIAYGDAGRRNLLDVYHQRTNQGGPVLVYFHGGGFRSGHKNREGKPLLHRLARHGWVCISANYRLAPKARFPDYLIDAKQAIAWARRNADRYGGDPTRIYVAGSSAGGHLAVTAALTPNDPSFQPDFGDVDTAVAGAISLYGFYGSPDSQPGVASTPHAYINADAPPTFIAHGDNDTCVLVDDARAFAHELDAVSTNPVVYAELPGAQHGFDVFRSARFEAVVDAIEIFTDRTGCGRPT
ncbi:alpha/beta hydrolase [Ilumatobacter sp.]|uniref:alpha/beta hydrolase n=1 Tax=Ilumatobacter sp. TaxID=1967498 RepID=UPI003C5C7770